MTTIRKINFQFFIYLIIVFLCSTFWVKDVSALITTNQPFRHPIIEKWGENFDFKDMKVEIIGVGIPKPNPMPQHGEPISKMFPLSIANPDTVEKIIVQVVFKGADTLGPGIHPPYPPGDVTINYCSHKKFADTGSNIVRSEKLTSSDRIDPFQSPPILDHLQYLYKHTLIRNEVQYDIEAIQVIVEDSYRSPHGDYTPRAAFAYIFRRTLGSNSTEIGTINRGYAWHVPGHPNNYRPEDFLYTQEMDIPRGESSRDIVITFAISELEQTPPGETPRGVILAAEYAGIERKRAIYIHSNLDEQALIDTLVLKDVPGYVTKIRAKVFWEPGIVDPVSDEEIGSDSVYVNGINVRIEGQKGKPGISIKKEVSVDGGSNWYDANTAPGPEADYCDCGDAMFRISVKNTGEVPLSNIDLTDDTYPDAVYDACRWKIPDIMQPGDEFTCEFTVPIEQGQHTDIATVTARTDAAASNVTVIKSYYNSGKTDTWVTNDKYKFYEKYGISTSHFLAGYSKNQYIGNDSNQYYAPRYAQPGTHPIYSGKVDFWNGQSNHYIERTPPKNGLIGADYRYSLNNGNPVFWLYDEWAPGRISLSNCWSHAPNWDTSVSESPCNSTQLGYALITENSAVESSQVSASDPANYIANTPQLGLDVEKYISADGATWLDADTPDEALEIAFGEDVYFMFVVTNNSSSALFDAVLSDTHFDTSECNMPDVLEPRTSFECILGPFTANEERHTNTASVVGYCCDLEVEDQDDANYKTNDRTPIPARFGGYLFWGEARWPKCQKEIQFTILLDDYTSEHFEDETLIGKFCEKNEQPPCASEVEFRLQPPKHPNGETVTFERVPCEPNDCCLNPGQYRLWVTGELNDGNKFEGLSEDIVTFD